MKKITIVLLLIVSLILPQTVEGAEDVPYNAWDSCARNFVKYSNAGEYCIIVEVQGSANDIQYILCHDIANRNPMIFEGGAIRRFLNLYDTSRYEVYYSDYVQSMTGLSSIFSGNKIELGVRHPSTGFYAEVVRTNYGLYNINGNLIYNANYYSEVTEVVNEPDWLTDNRLTGNPYYLAVFKITTEDNAYYNHYIGLQLEPWIAYFNNNYKIYVPKPSDDMPDPWTLRNLFLYTNHVQYALSDLGTALDNNVLNNSPIWNYNLPIGKGSKSSGNVTYYFINLENAQIGDTVRTPQSKLILYNWDYGANIIYTGSAGLAPTPILRPTVAPLASPTPIPDSDSGIFGLGNTIRRIFLPSPDILYNEVQASKDLLLNKLHIDLDAFKPDNGGRPSNVTMTLYGHNVTLLDFEQVEEVAEQARTPINIVRVFVYIFALWGLIKFIIDYFNNRGGGNNA